MDRNQIQALAKKIAANGNRMYRDGDCCPLCGYDAYWACDSLEESEQGVLAMLLEVLEVNGETKNEE